MAFYFNFIYKKVNPREKTSDFSKFYSHLFLFFLKESNCFGDKYSSVPAIES